MITKKPLSSHWFGSILVMCLVIASPATADEDPTYRATVKGGPDKPLEHLQAFHSALKTIIGVDDDQLASRKIGCDGCADLETSSGPDGSELTYIFAGTDINLYAFQRAWLDIQRKMHSASFTLTFDAMAPPQPLCEDLPQPCYYKPFCPQYGYCTRSQSSCRPCT